MNGGNSAEKYNSVKANASASDQQTSMHNIMKNEIEEIKSIFDKID